MRNVFKFYILFLLYIIWFPVIDAQVGKSDLKPLLSGSDQKNMEKIDLLYDKGKAIENEANIISSSGNTDKEKAKTRKSII